MKHIRKGANPEHPRSGSRSSLWLVAGAIALAGGVLLFVFLFGAGPVRERVVVHLLGKAAASDYAESAWARRIESLGAEETVWRLHQRSACKAIRSHARMWLGLYALQHGSSDLSRFARTRMRSILVDETVESSVRSEIAALFVLAENGLNDAYLDLLVAEDWELAQEALWGLTGWRTTVPRGATLAVGLARMNAETGREWAQTKEFRCYFVEGVRRALAVELMDRLKGSEVEQEYLRITGEPGAWRVLADDLPKRLYHACLDILGVMGESDGDLAKFVAVRVLVDSYVLPEEGEFSSDRLQERSNALLASLLESEDRQSFVGAWREVLWRHWGGDEEALEALRRFGEEAQAEGRDHARELCVRAVRLLSEPPPDESPGDASDDALPANRIGSH